MNTDDEALVTRFKSINRNYLEKARLLQNLVEMPENIDPIRFESLKTEYEHNLQELEPELDSLRGGIRIRIDEIKRELEGATSSIRELERLIEQENRLLKAGAILKDQCTANVNPLKNRLKQAQKLYGKVYHDIGVLESAVTSGESSQFGGDGWWKNLKPSWKTSASEPPSDPAADQQPKTNPADGETKPLSTKRVMLAIAGSAILIIGVFCPVLRVSFLGYIDFFQHSNVQGATIMVLAALSIVSVLTKKHRGLWITGFASLGIIAFSFIDLLVGLSDISKDGGMITGIIREMIRIHYGWAVLMMGAIFILLGAGSKEDAEEVEVR